MQGVAAEMNLSETAFLLPEEGGWRLRWFTPVAEVALCGHATLASAHVLWESGRLPLTEPARFVTRSSGVLTCVHRDDWIEMDFPSRPASEASVPTELVEALGVTPVWTGRTIDDFLCEFADEAAVRGLRPDLGALSRISVRGVIVTARGTGGWDFVSRFFAPAVGVGEDPVTGSAHCSLAPFWSARLGRPELRAWQASARGGEVRTRMMGDRVRLTGHAVTTWEGRWRGTHSTSP